MGRVNHSKCKKNKQYKKHHDTKRRRRDTDQVQDDLIKIKETGQEMKFPIDDDLPGLGQFYCITCAKHFMNQETLSGHCLSRPHKRR
jgi:bud site selection protein 20